MKKIISIIISSIIGLSFVFAKENAMSIINNTKIGNFSSDISEKDYAEFIYEFGFALCKHLYSQKPAEAIIVTYENFDDEEESILVEKEIISTLLEDKDFLPQILAKNATNNRLLEEFQDGCRDYLEDDLIFENKDFDEKMMDFLKTYLKKPKNFKEYFSQDNKAINQVEMMHMVQLFAKQVEVINMIKLFANYLGYKPFSISERNLGNKPSAVSERDEL